ncbi:hypothetical protein E2C01_071709 [Portunus trituberculatus]|uniref:Uncharacterized protein n=1 Tax=Portunus trituberculatus TaxID=210409 RepID=A0A5B7I6X5_PORTR|nr:hypothetical protein [Portunus trituberculatus]
MLGDAVVAFSVAWCCVVLCGGRWRPWVGGWRSVADGAPSVLHAEGKMCWNWMLENTCQGRVSFASGVAASGSRCPGDSRRKLGVTQLARGRQNVGLGSAGQGCAIKATAESRRREDLPQLPALVDNAPLPL